MERQFWWREDYEVNLRYPEYERLAEKTVKVRKEYERRKTAQQIGDKLVFDPATHQGYRGGRGGGRGGVGGGSDRGGPGSSAAGFATAR